MTFTLPYSPLPVKRLEQMSYRFLSPAQSILRVFPSLELTLRQAHIPFGGREYLSLCLVASLLFFLFFGLVMVVVLPEPSP